MSNHQPAVIVKDLYKSFRLPHEQHSGLKQFILNFFRRPSKRVHGYETQHVLEDISFEIQKGEFFGIVGRNGSGKSTLLKLLAGIYTPDKGAVQINGSLTPFIELGVGFNPELTGRENVYLNGALLGFSHDEMDAMYNDIVSFAELEKFMDQKLKNYSSGMQVRLAFSIAIRANSDILLIDEVLAVGDVAFQKKCYEHFASLKKQGKTVILVTHDMSAIERFCTKAAVIDKGKVVAVTTPHKAAKLYDGFNDETRTRKIGNRWGNKQAVIEDAYILNAEKKRGIFRVNHGSELTMRFHLSQSNNIRTVLLGLAIYNEIGVKMAGPNSSGFTIAPGKIVDFTIPKLSFAPGTYEVTSILFEEDAITELDHIEQIITFEVVSDKRIHGVVDLFGDWRIS